MAIVRHEGLVVEFCFTPFCFYVRHRCGVFLFKVRYHLVRVQVIPIDPLVFRLWVPLPLDEVLHFAPSSIFPRLEDVFDFVFFFPIDKVRRGFGEVRSVELGFMIRGQEVCMEDIVYLPLQRKCQLISDRR